jgi:hypothetical protein
MANIAPDRVLGAVRAARKKIGRLEVIKKIWNPVFVSNDILQQSL